MNKHINKISLKIKDFSRKLATLTALVCVSTVTLFADNVIQLNGTDSFITVADAPSNEFDFNYNLKTKSMTVMTWIKTTATSGTIYTRMSSGDRGFYAKLNPDGTVLARYSGDWGRADITTTTVINDGQWHHFAFVLTGQNIYSYIDGVLDVTANDAGFDDGYDTTENLYIGAESDGSNLLAAELADFRIYMDEDDTNTTASRISPFSAMIDSGAIYTPTHTIQELRLIFDGNANNVSGSAVGNGAITGTPSYNASFSYPSGEIFHYALDDANGSTNATDSSGNGNSSATLPASIVLDGTSAEITADGDVINTPDLGITTNTVTYAGWIKPKAGETIRQWSGILMCRSGAASGLMIYDNDATTGKLSAHWNDSWYPETNIAVTKGEWNFVVMAVSATETTFYAATASSADLASQTYTRSNTDAPVGVINIGMDNGGARTLLGNFQDMRIYENTLDSAAIEALFDDEKVAVLPPAEADDQSATVAIGNSDVAITLTGSNFDTFDNPTYNGTGTITPAVDYSTSGQLTYTPAIGFAGTDTFTFTTSKAGVPTSEVATVTIKVEGKIFHYKLDETDGATVVVDSTGNSPDSATLNNSIAFSNSNANITTDGEGIQIPNLNITLDTGGTLSGWIKPEIGVAIDSFTGIIFNRSGGTSGFALGALAQESATLGATTNLRVEWGGRYGDATTNATVKVGHWNFVALTMDPTTGTATIYSAVAGEDTTLRSDSFTNAAYTSPGVFNAPFLGLDTNNNSRTFIGKMRDMRMWNYELPETVGTRGAVEGLLQLYLAEESTVITPAIGLDVVQDGTTLTWSATEEVGVKEYQIVDVATGEVIAIVTAAQNSYTYELDSDAPVKLVVVDESGFKQTFYPENGNEIVVQYDLVKGWNMIAAPGKNADLSALDSELWGWNGTAYEVMSTLAVGEAAWVYAPTAKSVTVTAEKAEAKLILNQGWNMTGPTENMIIPEEAIMIYSWNETYQQLTEKDDTLIRGIGYWIFCF